MFSWWRLLTIALIVCAALVVLPREDQQQAVIRAGSVHHAAAIDVSPPLSSIQSVTSADVVPDCDSQGGGCGTSPPDESGEEEEQDGNAPAKVPLTNVAGAAIEQKSQGSRP